MSEPPLTVAANKKSKRDPWILAALLAFPSFGFVQKYSGLAGVVAYTVVVFLVVAGIDRFGNKIIPFVEKRFRVISVLSIAALIIGFVVLHPFEDRRGPGKSSDRNEGLELAVSRLANGEFPYYSARVFPGPLSVLPGSIILSAPFVPLGNSGYQNIFWLSAFLIASARWFQNRAWAVILLIVPIVISPASLYEFISGGDLIANGIFVCLFALYALITWSDAEAPNWKKWTSCILLGVGLASRANFILLIPLFGAVLWRNSSPSKATVAATIVALSTVAVCLPFYLHNPAGFTPLGSSHKLAIVDGVLPWASKAMIGMTVLMTAAGAIRLMVRKNSNPIASFFRWCTVVTVTPMICAVLLSSWVHGKPDFGFMHDRFGLMYVFFALIGWGASWTYVVKAETQRC